MPFSLPNISRSFLASCLALSFYSISALANDVTIVAAEFTQDGQRTWKVDVSLMHSDTGWDHYANMWRVVDVNGTVLGERELLHPHVNEQPFARSLSKVPHPAVGSIVYIEARDKVHGWSPQRFEVDLSQAQQGHLLVEMPK
ncbi:hypothetical protein [Agarivorans albus]|uniref:Uncharacterized protein n=1 Tax=Agarivorans albus MKT 106 TaxID=1331007 RepID=R9PRV0_AGAAL|nr:hypothetical protein [Agarivorans albus]GAD00816.1 hypothetical protein AALB_0896 [Agarivorans albus MKT 106]